MSGIRKNPEPSKRYHRQFGEPPGRPVSPRESKLTPAGEAAMAEQCRAANPRTWEAARGITPDQADALRHALAKLGHSHLGDETWRAVLDVVVAFREGEVPHA